MNNTTNKKGQKQGIWQTQNKAKTLLVEENYKNGILHGKRAEIYKGDWFREQFYMNGQLFGETLRNNKPIIHKFHELNDYGEWKTDKEKYPNSKFWFVDEKCMFEYDYQDGKNKKLHVEYDGFWSVFELEFCMNYQEISHFIQHQAEEQFKFKVDTTSTPPTAFVVPAEEQFKFKVDTTRTVSLLFHTLAEEQFKFSYRRNSSSSNSK